jgi:hypothetical protein
VAEADGQFKPGAQDFDGWAENAWDFTARTFRWEDLSTRYRSFRASDQHDFLAVRCDVERSHSHRVFEARERPGLHAGEVQHREIQVPLHAFHVNQAFTVW